MTPPMRKPTPDEMVDLLANARGRLRHDVWAIEDTLDQLRHQARIRAEVASCVDAPPTAFGLFLSCEMVDTETVQQADDRVVANYIRHEMTSYDDIRAEHADKWLLDNFYHCQLWDIAMDAIVARWPELEDAQVHGRDVRRRFRRNRHEWRERAAVEERVWRTRAHHTEDWKVLDGFKKGRTQASRALAGRFCGGDWVNWNGDEARVVRVHPTSLTLSSNGHLVTVPTVWVYDQQRGENVDACPEADEWIEQARRAQLERVVGVHIRNGR